MPFLYRIAALLAVLAPLFAAPVNAQAPERRLALVIGNTEYKAGRLPTAANDAGLIAETLRTAGFDVAGARDLDQDTLRRSIREFLDKVSSAGPQAVSFVYLAGYGLQFEGENYIVPIDASIRRDEDIPIEAIRISDFTRPLAGTPGAVKLVVVDAARQHPFTPAGPPLASGLALVEPDPGMLIAFNATPGSIAPIENGPYGAFAQAFAEMIGTGGLGLDDLFARLRLRVNEKTNGVEVPWYASKITQPFLFMERTPDAPPPPQVTASMELQSRSIREFNGDQEAYAAALERDTLGGYEEFEAAYPDSPLSGRVRALIAVRREAITWRRTVSINTPEAYWSYLERYPQGAHVADAQRRLARLAAAYDPPPAFVPMAYADVDPPPPDEVVYLTQPAVVFDGPGFLPPPPVPVFFLPPPPPEFLVLAPPPPPIGAFFLPVPVVSFSVTRPWVRPPAFVQAPPRVPIQQITINNTTIINQRPGGNAAALSAPLPNSLVTRVNSGALKAPPPAAAAPAPIQAASLTGTGALGNKQTTLPPSARTGTVTTTPGSGPPQGAVTPNQRQLAPNTATTTPGGGTPQGAVTPGQRQLGPNTATTTPGGGTPQGAATPNQRQLAPNAATTTPGGGTPQGAVTPGQRQLGPNTATTTPGGGTSQGTVTPNQRQLAPNTATTTPGSGPPQGAITPGQRQLGPNTATTTPSGATPQGVVTPSQRQLAPNTATTTPGGGPPQGLISPGGPRPTGPNTATTTPNIPPSGSVEPGGGRPIGPNTATTAPNLRQEQIAPAGRRPAGPATATTTPGPTGPRPGAGPPPQLNRQIGSPPSQTPPPRSPQVVNRPPPPAAPPPPAVVRTPPPPAEHVAPPPPAARAAPPPPPPVARAAPPPPPPQMRIAPQAPPPPAARMAPPPQAAARPAPPPAAGRRCVVQNGQQVCN